MKLIFQVTLQGQQHQQQQQQQQFWHNYVANYQNLLFDLHYNLQDDVKSFSDQTYFSIIGWILMEILYFIHLKSSSPIVALVKFWSLKLGIYLNIQKHYKKTLKKKYLKNFLV